MIGVDTNVLVRWLTADNEDEHVRATRLVTGAGESGLYLSDIVLIELVWVLLKTYKMRREAVMSAVENILDTREFVFAGRGLALEAVHMAQQHGCDFADALLSVRNREAGCMTTATFDRKAGRLPAMTPVEDILP